MRNRVVVAIMATTGLLTSTIALAEINDNPATPKLSNSFEVPAFVAADVAAPVAVEPTLSSNGTSSNYASTAQADPADSLSELLERLDVAQASNEDIHCLATTVYYEARSESLAGQLAVANVVLERSKSGRFPKDLCGVVKQAGQFSFVKGGRLPTAPNNAGQWNTAKAIAHIAMEGSWANPVQGALFFHSSRVSPGWRHERLTRIGGHVFYR